MEVIKILTLWKAKLEYGDQDAATKARLLEHYHRMRLYEAEVLSKKVNCRECPHRH